MREIDRLLRGGRDGGSRRGVGGDGRFGVWLVRDEGEGRGKAGLLLRCGDGSTRLELGGLRWSTGLTHLVQADEAVPTHHVGELPKNLAREVGENGMEVEGDVTGAGDHNEALAFLHPPSLVELLLRWIKTIDLGSECLGQLLERLMESREGLSDGLVGVFGRVEDADDAVDSAMDLEFGEEGERMGGGVGGGGEVFEQQRAGRVGSSGEDGCWGKDP